MQAGRTAGYGQESLRLVQDALRLSAHVVRLDPSQLAGQLVGRLLSSDDRTVTRLLQQAQDRENAAWIRPLSAMLTAAGGPLLRIIEGGATAVAVTPDGRYAVSGSQDQTLKVWDLVNGVLVATFSGENMLCACAVAPDGRTIVAGDRGGVHFLRIEGIGSSANGVA